MEAANISEQPTWHFRNAYGEDVSDEVKITNVEMKEGVMVMSIEDNRNIEYTQPTKEEQEWFDYVNGLTLPELIDMIKPDK